MAGPLEGIKIIDWTIWQQGPVATVMLADLGAEVIKIEERERGDPGRGLVSAGTDGQPGDFYFEANNRHKKSLALNLKTPQAREIVYRLVANSDVFVQNFRKGVPARLGLDYESLAAINPRLIYASATGYGPAGPDSGKPSFDYMGQARSGIMNAVGGRELPPTYVFGGVADQMGGIMMAYGIITALFVRERTSIGQEVDISHLGSMMALQGLNVSSVLLTGREMPRRPRDNAYNPLWNHYKCSDGRWLCLGMLQPDRYWVDFCRALGLGELAADPRYEQMVERGKHSREIVATLDKAFATRTRDEWIEILERSGDFIFTIMNTIADLPDDPQVVANDYVVSYEHPRRGKVRLPGLPVRLSRTPGDSRAVAPELGEHTEEILVERLGFSWEDVARLREEGVI
jgi:crotonobetainyl-CoA:carnitine CoA-transferase CaiB-like acyl-CoA transferase